MGKERKLSFYKCKLDALEITEFTSVFAYVHVCVSVGVHVYINILLDITHNTLIHFLQTLL